MEVDQKGQECGLKYVMFNQCRQSTKLFARLDVSELADFGIQDIILFYTPYGYDLKPTVMNWLGHRCP